MATDARAYYDVDTQGFGPNTEQTRAFNQATAGVNPDTGQAWTTQERQQLSDFFANQARKAQAQLPQNTAAPSGAKAPAQKLEHLCNRVRWLPFRIGYVRLKLKTF